MYIRNRERVAQLSMSYDSLVGNLGNNTFSPDVQELLTRVSRHPLNHQNLLLTVMFHPDPLRSRIEIAFRSGTALLIDLALIYLDNKTTLAFLDTLRQIGAQLQKTNKDFQKQVELELNLRNRMYQAVGRAVRNMLLRSKGTSSHSKLRYFLLRISPSDSSDEVRLGKSFADSFLSPNSVQQLLQSKVPEAHFANLGRLVQRYATVSRAQKAPHL